MSEITATRCFSFEAAHHLPDYPGACARVHGHTYKCHLTVSRGGGTSGGMVIDFAALQQFIDDELMPVLDHKNLNENGGQGIHLWDQIVIDNPTAERIAQWIMEYSQEAFNNAFPAREFQIVNVCLWETENSYVMVVRV